jgi:hypothetical protein
MNAFPAPASTLERPAESRQADKHARTPSPGFDHARAFHAQSERHLADEVPAYDGGSAIEQDARDAFLIWIEP